jgi:hypothetical protein
MSIVGRLGGGGVGESLWKARLADPWRSIHGYQSHAERPVPGVWGGRRWGRYMRYARAGRRNGTARRQPVVAAAGACRECRSRRRRVRCPLALLASPRDWSAMAVDCQQCTHSVQSHHDRRYETMAAMSSDRIVFPKGQSRRNAAASPKLHGLCDADAARARHHP